VPSRLALEAAVNAARALGRRLSGVYIEDSELMQLAALSCAREVSLTGRHADRLTPERLAEEMRLVAASAHRELKELAQLAGIDLEFEIVRDNPVMALEGPVEPGALLALGEAFTATEAARLSHLLNEADAISGALITGPRAHRVRGPIVVAVEEAARMPILITYAERLQSEGRMGIVLLLVADTPQRIAELKAAAGRLPRPDAVLSLAQALISRAVAGRGAAGILAEAVIRYQGGFAIAHLGRLIRAREREVQMLAQTLECPLLLLK
jgi:hypothetical protein